MSREDAPMRFKAIRTKDNKKYFRSGQGPQLFKEHEDLELILDNLFWPREDYEIVTVELNVIESEEK